MSVLVKCLRVSMLVVAVVVASVIFGSWAAYSRTLLNQANDRSLYEGLALLISWLVLVLISLAVLIGVVVVIFKRAFGRRTSWRNDGSRSRY